VSVPLTVIEQIVSSSGVATAIEQMLPAGVRERQLTASTLLTGMMLALADGRPAHLTRVLEALLALPEDDQKRLGVIAQWKDGPHPLTYRQVEHTHRLITKALAKTGPDGAPSAGLQKLCDQLLEASIPPQFKDTSSSLALDWTDVEAWARAVPQASAGRGTDPEARWGHRNAGRAIEEGEMFFGYHMPAAVMVNDENGPAVPELVRRITVCSSAHDPAAALVPVLQDMAVAGIQPGDILAGSGFSHRQASTWAVPLRGLGAELVQDLHPADRGPRGTHHGAVICNGCLYCPKTPPALLKLIPLPPGASAAEVAAHDQQTTELSRYKLGLHAGDDADGYRRHACPATAGKIRCPLKPPSMTPGRDRPEILSVPEHPPACCTQKTITAGPEVAEKTRQKHDYPSARWRTSYQRRTAAERLNASIKDTAANSTDRGWIRLTGITPLMLWLTCLTAVRNQRILIARQARQDHNQRRAAAGLPPHTRKRRRALTSTSAGPAPP
jgi:hypothetical protein